LEDPLQSDLFLCWGMKTLDVISQISCIIIVQDSEGQTGPFLEELNKQSEEERQLYVQDVFDALDGKS